MCWCMKRFQFVYICFWNKRFRLSFIFYLHIIESPLSQTWFARLNKNNEPIKDMHVLYYDKNVIFKLLQIVFTVIKIFTIDIVFIFSFSFHSKYQSIYFFFNSRKNSRKISREWNVILILSGIVIGCVHVFINYSLKKIVIAFNFQFIVWHFHKILISSEKQYPS